MSLPGNLGQSLGDPHAVLDQLDRFDAEGSLLDFIPLVWPTLEPGRTFVPGWPVEAICEHLEAVSRGEIRRLLINVPPGCMKSLLTNVLWPAWEWGPRNEPWRRYVTASYSEALTIRDNRRCRNVITSDVYQRYWGDRFKFAADQSAKLRYDTDATGFKIATSVGGLATGERGDRFIIDDPHNVKDSESDAKREAALQWFTEVVPTRLNDPDKSAIVVIMQRVHERDVSGLILERELNYEHLCLPMEYEREHRCFTTVPRHGTESERVCKLKREQEPLPRWLTEEQLQEETTLPAGWAPNWQVLTCQDRREEEDELLWPARFSQRHLDEDLKPSLRAWGGTYAEAGQLQQRPAPRGGGMFQRDDFQFLDIAPAGAQWVRGYDLAGSKRKTSPYTVGCKMCVHQGRVIIGDVWRERLKPGEVETRMKLTAEADGVGVDIDVPQDPGQAGLAQVAAFKRLLEGYPVWSSPESGDKETRARPLAAQAELGSVYLVRGTWNDAFISEACVFPNSTYKDQIDAASRAYARASKKRPANLGAAPKVING